MNWPAYKVTRDGYVNRTDDVEYERVRIGAVVKAKRDVGGIPRGPMGWEARRGGLSVAWAPNRAEAVYLLMLYTFGPDPIALGVSGDD